MEETTVLIVGAGPSGLALAVNLGRSDIKARSAFNPPRMYVNNFGRLSFLKRN